MPEETLQLTRLQRWLTPSKGVEFTVYALLLAALTGAACAFLWGLDLLHYPAPGGLPPSDDPPLGLLALAGMSFFLGGPFGGLVGLPVSVAGALLLPQDDRARRQWPLAVSGGAVGALAGATLVTADFGALFTVGLLGALIGVVCWHRFHADPRRSWRVIGLIWCVAIIASVATTTVHVIAAWR